MQKQIVLSEQEYSTLLEQLDESKSKVPYEVWHECSKELNMYKTLLNIANSEIKILKEHLNDRKSEEYYSEFRHNITQKTKNL